MKLGEDLIQYVFGDIGLKLVRILVNATLAYLYHGVMIIIVPINWCSTPQYQYDTVCVRNSIDDESVTNDELSWGV